MQLNRFSFPTYIEDISTARRIREMPDGNDRALFRSRSRIVHEKYSNGQLISTIRERTEFNYKQQQRKIYSNVYKITLKIHCKRFIYVQEATES